MGWYLRKSMSFGGLRFNFSKSGIGLSTGIKGLRFGVGPRGSYIHAGGNGLYYRQSFGEKSNINTNSYESNYSTNDIETLTDKESSDIILKIKKNRRKFVFFPLAFIFCFIPTVGILIALVIAVLLYVLVDRKIKKTPLLYDFQKGYTDWENALNELTQCSEVSYVINDETTLWQKKIKLQFTPPKDIDTNVTVLQMKIGKTKLYFFPDRLLIYNGRKICSINYKNMLFYHYNVVMTLEGKIPADGTVVGYTWLHTRQDGFPDRRYSFNPKLPELNYSIISFASNTGLSEQKIIFSRPDTGQLLVSIINCTFCKTEYDAQRQLSMFFDEKKLEEAKEVIKNEKYVNISFLQHRLKIGYNQASEIVDILIEQNELKPDNDNEYRVVNFTNNKIFTTLDINHFYPKDITEEDLMDISPLIEKYVYPNEDDILKYACVVIILDRKVSISHLQQRLNIDYNKATEILNQLKNRKFITPSRFSDDEWDIMIFDELEIG